MNKSPQLYDDRNKEKKKLQSKFRTLIIKVGDIRNCKIGVNLGSELSKDEKFIRPVIVLKTKIGGDLVLVAPLTSNYNSKYDRNYPKLLFYCGFILKPKTIMIASYTRLGRAT